jgi:hypothetical protein
MDVRPLLGLLLVGGAILAVVSWLLEQRRANAATKLEEIVQLNEQNRLKAVVEAIIQMLQACPSIPKTAISTEWRQVTTSLVEIHKKTGSWGDLPTAVRKLRPSAYELYYAQKEALVAMLRAAEGCEDISPNMVKSFKWVA